MFRLRSILFLVVVVLAALANSASADLLWGRVVDQDGQGLSGALVLSGAQRAISAADGEFLLEDPVEKVAVKRPGFLAAHVDIEAAEQIELQSFHPRALYLSFYGAAHQGLRGRALELIERTELNAVVIDIKGDRGELSYPSSILQAHDIGAQELVTLPHLAELVAELKGRGIYTIARIVVFKDNLFAEACPGSAVMDQSGRPWKDREKLGWVDPHQPEVVAYNLQVAEEAAQLGFDEVQFDYVRFPDTARLVFAKPNSFINRISAINDFLRQAKKILDGYGVYVSADVFGYICWNENDTYIGQHLETLLPHVDYLSPMLYPSGFSHGLPGFPSPMEAPYEMIYLSLEQAYRRTGADPLRFRPWLQAFKDYAFDRRRFKAAEISAQIRAANDFGSNGYMLWNAANRYSDAGLPVAKSVEVAGQTDEQTKTKPQVLQLPSDS
ncbi:putative glycoside hydrolase [Malonomonas rubra]|uniref:putative glycoside hydrolase n=1 Tax=Malonomonas rubra TaxID=57040 RepID=UPI0026EF9F3E|nr:putative glycoside hydrolase [Malonomonas rubra]